MGATFSDRPSVAGPRYVFSPAVLRGEPLRGPPQPRGRPRKPRQCRQLPQRRGRRGHPRPDPPGLGRVPRHRGHAGLPALPRPAPSPAEQGNAANYLATATPEQLAALLVEQPEFFNDYGQSTDVFVEALYGDILDSTASSIERAGWVQLITNNGTRAGVAGTSSVCPPTSTCSSMPTTPPMSAAWPRRQSRPTWPRCGPASTASTSRPCSSAMGRPSPGGLMPMRRGRVALALGSQSAISSSCPRPMASPRSPDSASLAISGLGLIAAIAYAARRAARPDSP